MRLYADRVVRLTLCEWKLREQSSMFGFAFTLLQPLLLFTVLYGLFTKWMGSRTEAYAFYLLIGIVQYGFFNAGTTVGLTSMSRRRGVILNFKIPRDAVVLAAVLSVALSHAAELGLMLAFTLALGGKLSAAWLFLPALGALELLLVAGVSFWLAALGARFPDLERVWSVLMTAGFFVTPVFYTLDAIDPSRRRLLLLSPVTRIIEMTRGCVLRGEAPPLAVFAGVAVAAAAVAATGWAFFKSRELEIADWVAV